VVQLEEYARQPFAAAEGDAVDGGSSKRRGGTWFEADGEQRHRQRLGLASREEAPGIAEAGLAGETAAVAEGGIVRLCHGCHSRGTAHRGGDEQRPSSVQVRGHRDGLPATLVL